MTEDTLYENEIDETPVPLPEAPPGWDPENEGPWWAHGTKETNPHWPYAGPAMGWVHA